MAGCMTNEQTIERIDKVCDGLEKLRDLFANGTKESWCCGIGKNLLKEYKSSLINDGTKKPKFMIGDKVRVTHSDFCYPSYSDFVKENASDFFDNCIYGGRPRNVNYVVRARAPHSDFPDRILYVIQDPQTYQVFVMDERGLEKADE